jgi:SdpC family antimicrobial peptide
MDGRSIGMPPPDRWRHLRRTAVVVVMAMVAAGGLNAAGPSASAARPESSADSAVAKTTPSRPKGYDGATLLKGLFFGLGPAAVRHPDLVLARVEGAEAATRVDAMIAEAERREPGFLGRFSTAMYSGNHVDIQLAAEDAGRSLGDAAKARYGTESAPEPDGTGTCVTVNLAVAVNVTLAFNFAAFAAVAVYTAFAMWASVYFDPSGPSPDVSRDLAAERWVDAVAGTL